MSEKWCCTTILLGRAIGAISQVVGGTCNEGMPPGSEPARRLVEDSYGFASGLDSLYRLEGRSETSLASPLRKVTPYAQRCQKIPYTLLMFQSGTIVSDLQ